MNAVWERAKREPALVVGLLGAVFLVLTQFGAPLSDSQQAALTGLAVAVMAFTVRSQVTPNASVAAKEAAARKADDENRTLVAGEAAPVPEGEPVTVVPEGVVETQQWASAPGRDDDPVGIV